MNYLITGGAGFIGSHIVDELVRLGHNVKVIDNLATGDMKNLEQVKDKIEFIHADINDEKALKKAVDGIDVVLHQAALPSVPRSIKNPAATMKANVDGSLKLLIAARDNGVKRFVYASSSSVYGDSPALPKIETMSPNPLSPYAVSKYASELYCRLFYQLYGLKTIILRYFNVFGPRQSPESQYAAVIPLFIKAAMKEEKPVIFGDGEQTRDFTFVKNVVDANMLASSAKNGFGEVMNIACGEQFTINYLLEQINALLGTNMEARYEKPRAGDIKHSLADIKKAKDLIGYEPKTSFLEGLKKTVEWHKNQNG